MNKYISLVQTNETFCRVSKIVPDGTLRWAVCVTRNSSSRVRMMEKKG